MNATGSGSGNRAHYYVISIFIYQKIIRLGKRFTLKTVDQQFLYLKSSGPVYLGYGRNSFPAHADDPGITHDPHYGRSADIYIVPGPYRRMKCSFPVTFDKDGTADPLVRQHYRLYLIYRSRYPAVNWHAHRPLLGNSDALTNGNLLSGLNDGNAFFPVMLEHRDDQSGRIYPFEHYFII